MRENENYIFKGEHGELYDVSNLKEFCLERFLDIRDIRKLISGEQKTHMGLRLIGTSAAKITLEDLFNKMLELEKLVNSLIPKPIRENSFEEIPIKESFTDRLKRLNAEKQT